MSGFVKITSQSRRSLLQTNSQPRRSGHSSESNFAPEKSSRLETESQPAHSANCIANETNSAGKCIAIALLPAINQPLITTPISEAQLTANYIPKTRKSGRNLPWIACRNYPRARKERTFPAISTVSTGRNRRLLSDYLCAVLL